MDKTTSSRTGVKRGVRIYERDLVRFNLSGFTPVKMPTARFPSRFKGLNEDKWRIVASRFCTEPFWNAIKRGTTKYDAGAATVDGAPLRSVTFRFASLPSFSPFSSTSHRLPPIVVSYSSNARNTSVLSSLYELLLRSAQLLFFLFNSERDFTSPEFIH